MSTRINTNVTALAAAHNLAATSDQLAASIQRLSSGLRINDAADDPAGYAIAQNMTAQISGLAQAGRNANDATNLVKTADGALSQVQSLLVSIRQLAVAASNAGASSSVAISADQSQINSALASINQIAQTTAYGGKNLLDGSASATGVTHAGSAAVAAESDFGLLAQGTWSSSGPTAYTNVSLSTAGAARFVIGTAGYAGTSPAPLDTNATFGGSILIDGQTYDLAQDSQVTLSGFNQIIAGSGYQASIDTSNDLVLTDTTAGALPAQSIDASNLVISGAAPATLSANGTIVQGSNVMEFAAGGGTGGNLSDVAAVDASTPVSVSGTLQITDTDTTSNLGTSFQQTYANGTTLNQVQEDLNTAFGGGIQASIQGGAIVLIDQDNNDALTSTSNDFQAYNTATVTGDSFQNGTEAIMTIADAGGAHTLSSSGGVIENGSTYYAFSNGLVLSSTVAASASGATQLLGSLDVTAGSSQSGTALTFQLGASSGQTMMESIESVETDQIGRGASTYTDADGTSQTPWATSLADINVTTFKGAQDAIAVVDKAIDDVSTLGANLGALQTNILQSDSTSLAVAGQNLQASLSTVQDVDLSTEIVNFTKLQILTQAGVSALSQANQAPQALLKLLQ